MNGSDVVWQVDGIDVAATLTRPPGPGPFPAVVMVAGSGPTDRNWNSPLLPGTNGSAALLAEVLTDDGFLTLRYDKRASGPNAVANAARMQGKISMAGHRQELAGAVQFLTTRTDADVRRLFALTNSEGCIHALNYQLQPSGPQFAGLVLTGAPGRSVGDVARAQVVAQLAAVPNGSALLAAYDAAIADFLAGRPVHVDPEVPAPLRDLVLAVSAPVNQPFSRELWSTNPAALAAPLDVPILVVIGQKDLQVDWQADGGVWVELARACRNVTTDFPADANHVLKQELSPRSDLLPGAVAASYNADDAVLDPEAVRVITSWLRDRS
jgi:pimeloyl-ACP methyl ester carboxylesterase